MTLSEFIEELKKLEMQGYGNKEVYYEHYAPVCYIGYSEKLDRVLLDIAPI